MIVVEVSNRQTQLAVNTDSLRKTVHDILRDHGVEDARVSLALVSDPEIHELNARYLDHDYPTDVLSFLLEEEGPLEGEVIVSAETATREATARGDAEIAELTWYVIHGTLHLLGYDDAGDADRQKMREREEWYLRKLEIGLPSEPFLQRATDRSQDPAG